MNMMKKCLALPILVASIASCGNSSGGGDGGNSTPVSDFSLNYYEAHHGYFIEDYTGKESEIYIPKEATIEGRNAPIVGIKGYAFSKRTNLTSIHLSENVHTIENFAFADSGLKKLYVTGFLVNIEPYALDNCPLELTERDGVKYLPGRYGDCGYAISYSGLSYKEITLPDECEGVYDDVFVADQEIRVSSHMQCFGSIGEKAGYMSKDQSWNFVDYIPNTVTKAGNNAFRHSPAGPKDVVLSNGCDFIGDYAFARGCDGNSVGCVSIQTISVPETVTRIGERAFWGCPSLEKINLPSSITSIGAEAFSFCFALTSIVIPKSVETIGDRAFASCMNAHIYCEAEEKPEGWASNWDLYAGSVEWGYKG